MDRKVKLKLAAGAIAGLAAVGAGAAVAATQLGSPKEESQAVINDAAKELGIQPSKLSDALKKALENRIDAAVKAGRLTKEQGDKLKSGLESGDFPLFAGPGFGFGHGVEKAVVFADLSVAATYLGLTPAELRTELEAEKSLADVAKAKGKSVDGLIDALVDSAKSRLDEAVKNGKLPKEQETEMLNGLKDRITDLVNGRLPGPPHFDGFRGDRFGGGFHFRGDRFGGDRFGRDSFRGGPAPFLLPTA